MKTFARKKAVDLNTAVKEVYPYTEVQEVELTVEPTKPKPRGRKKKTKEVVVEKEK